MKPFYKKIKFMVTLTDAVGSLAVVILIEALAPEATEKIIQLLIVLQVPVVAFITGHTITDVKNMKGQK